MTRVLLLLLLAGCPNGFVIGGNPNDVHSLPGVDQPTREPDESFEGNLEDGEVITLEWSQSLYCWPGNEGGNFSGAHVLYERTQDAGHDLYVKAGANGQTSGRYAVEIWDEPGGSYDTARR